MNKKKLFSLLLIPLLIYKIRKKFKKKHNYKYINKYLKIEIKKVGDKKIIIIDNFLKNPESFIKVKSANLTYDDNSAYPGIRVPVNINIHYELKHFIENNIKKEYGFTAKTRSDFYHFSIINESIDSLEYGSKLPHQDCGYNNPMQPNIPKGYRISGVATVVYLCNQSEKYGGTAIYNLKKDLGNNNFYTDPKNKNLIDKLFEYRNNKGYMQDKEEIFFEKVYEVPVKFNRVIFYPTYYFHQPVINSEYFKKTIPLSNKDTRLTLTGWQKYNYLNEITKNDIETPILVNLERNFQPI